jgi:hypothetical protein
MEKGQEKGNYCISCEKKTTGYWRKSGDFEGQGASCMEKDQETKEKISNGNDKTGT